MQEVWDADEVLVCSTAKLIDHADTLDGKPVGMKDPDTYHRLQDAYFARIKAECGYEPIKG
jgi:D-alanine transaminase